MITNKFQPLSGYRRISENEMKKQIRAAAEKVETARVPNLAKKSLADIAKFI